MTKIQIYSLLIYLSLHSQFPVIIGQASTDKNISTSTLSIINVTSQPSINKPKGNLTCVHYNYDLYMTFFNSSVDIEDYLANSKSVFCLWKKSNGISETEERPLTEIRKLEIKNSTMQKIPNKIFSNFSKLLIFKAREAKIQEIHTSDFASADYLIYLDLSRNEIKNLENQIFLNLISIKEIDLSYNKLDILDDGAFDLVGGNLTRIDLSNNKIKSFKEDYFLALIVNTSRKWLPFDINLKNNEIETIESSKRNAVLLPEINLQLSGNKLKTLELLKIEMFEIILKNFTLENINVNASYVTVDNNRLKTYRIKGKTRSLSLQNNLISSLTYDDYLSVMRQMFLSGNNLSSDALYDVLKKVTNLEILEISNNPLKTLKIDMFSELPMLQKLLLSKTSLTELHFGVFAYQGNLRILDISYNSLNNVDFHLFSSNANLEILDLSGTNISKLDECRKIGEILPRLKLVGVEDNNWKCDVLSNTKACLNTQLIKLMIPDNPTKNMSNIMGVKCTANDELTTVIPKDASTTSSYFIGDIMDKINKLDEKLFDSKISPSEKRITSLELTLSILLSVSVTVLALYAVYKANKYLKFNRFRMPRLSRRNSPDTIVTYDGSIER